MPFQPGHKLAVGGRKEKPFRDALMLAIKDAEADPKALRKVAEKLLSEAMNGNIPAIKELADRLDGKVPQAIIGGDDGDSPLIIEGVTWRILEPGDNNGTSLPAPAKPGEV